MPLRSLTRLEAHFLRAVRRAVLEKESPQVEISELYLLYPGDEPGLRLAMRVPGSALFFCQVLIYGSRPVRYQVEFGTDAASRRSRALWDHCLGRINLIDDKSGVRDKRTQLFYEVTYPEAFLKRLGE